MSAQRLIRAVVVGWLAVGGGLLAQEKPEQMAQRSDEAWLERVDASKYPESWQSASAMFRSAVTEESWDKTIEAVRTPLGKVETRKLMKATYTKTLPGAPDGEYVVIQYQTSFEHKKEAVETVISTREKAGGWRLAGYFIK